MPRPCTNDHPPSPTACRLCWLCLNNPAYAKLWGEPLAHTASQATGPCKHLGSYTAETVKCPSCRGNVSMKLAECAVHGRCLPTRQADGVRSCLDCPDRVIPGPAKKPDLGKFFDRVYLINLKRRSDRLEQFQRFQKERGWPLGTVEVLAAIDGNKVGVPQHFTEGGGAWGCCRSHVAVLERAIMDDLQTVLVLEDDAEWNAGMWPALQLFVEALPKDWDQLMLGGQHHETPTPVVPGVVRVRKCSRTHAYALRGGAVMRSLLALWYGCHQHIDWWMADWQQGWQVFAPEPFVFGQSAGRSDISGKGNKRNYWS